MRYALTYMIGGWSDTDTIIIDDRSGGSWYGDSTKVKEILEHYGLHEDEARAVADDRLYYVRNLDDTDITLDINGEIL